MGNSTAKIPTAVIPQGDVTGIIFLGAFPSLLFAPMTFDHSASSNLYLQPHSTPTHAFL